MVRMGVLEATSCGSVLAVGLEVLPPMDHDPVLRTLWAPETGPHLLLSHVSLETWAPLGPPDCSHHFRPRYGCRSSL